MITSASTLDDLLRFEGKAELIGGRVVPIVPTGRVPGRIAKRILRSLDDYERSQQTGEALGDNVGYAIHPPLGNGRESFSPDASFYIGASPHDDAGFIEGPPTFAVEVRSEHDYGPAKDLDYAEKREDYFRAGTRVVWDVDYLNETVAGYAEADPETPVMFHRGEVAHAEPALPGWRMNVDEIFA